jgi:hypothetical protein
MDCTLLKAMAGGETRFSCALICEYLNTPFLACLGKVN